MKRKIKTGSIIIGGFLFYVLFYGKGIGVNLALFGIFFTVILIPAQMPDMKNRKMQALLAAVIISIIAVALHGSSLAAWGLVAALILTTGYAYQPVIRFQLFALLNTGHNYAQIPFELISNFPFKTKHSIRWRRYWRAARVSVLPLVAVWVFFSLYRSAVPQFDMLSTSFLRSVNDILVDVFDFFSFRQVLFALLGAYLTAGASYHFGSKVFLNADQRFDDNLTRASYRNSFWHRFMHELTFRFKALALKREFMMGIILLSAVNLLLLAVVVTDITTVWFNFQITDAPTLSQFVHEGTYQLIFSILLSICILLYLFRGNLNFYSQNRWLKWLAYSWIFLNGLMVVAVAIRNFHYFTYYGLTGKRIGVFIFLLLVLFGLVSMIVKIAQRKHLFYLIRANIWPALTILILSGLFSWDRMITKYNLSHIPEERIDYRYLLRLSSHNLPLLTAHFRQNNAAAENKNLTAHIHRRSVIFIKNYKSRDWQEWTYSDYRTFQQLHSIIKNKE